MQQTATMQSSKLQKVKTTCNNQKNAQKLKKETNNKQKTYLANTFERAKMNVLYLKVSIVYNFQFEFCRKMQDGMLLKTKKIVLDSLLLHRNMVEKPKHDIQGVPRLTNFFIFLYLRANTIF
jgi:hypothetical protein